jgi:hypothetical protein
MRQSMRLLMLPLAAAVVTFASLFTVPVANTQTRSPSPGPSEQTPKNIPDQKLDAAAAALEQVASGNGEKRREGHNCGGERQHQKAHGLSHACLHLLHCARSIDAPLP